MVECPRGLGKKVGKGYQVGTEPKVWGNCHNF